MLKLIKKIINRKNNGKLRYNIIISSYSSKTDLTRGSKLINLSITRKNLVQCKLIYPDRRNFLLPSRIFQ